MKKKKIRISTVLLLVLLFVLLCVVACAGWKLYCYYAAYSKDRDLYSDLRDEVIKSEEKENEAEETTKDYLKTTEEYLENGGKKYRKKRKRISKSAPISVDWDELKEINEDIIGWVYFTGLPQISYPVLQADDNEYYVHRIGRTGRAGKNGKAFTFITGREFYKLKDIQRYCRTKIIAKQVPSLNDVANVKADKIFEKVAGMIDEDNLKPYIRMIEEKLEKEDYTTLDLAAAFLRMALGDEDKSVEVDDFGDTGAEDGMVRLFINIGKNQKARPGDILGAIAGETGIAGSLIGTIDMYDKYTFVEVPKEYARDVLNAMSHARIKGRNINIEPANRK